MLRSLLFALALWAGAARADSGLIALETLDAGRGWGGVGRIDIAGNGFCTGAMISDRLVLTAAHCLYDREGDLIPAGDLSFSAGLRNGRAAAYRQVRRAIAHPGFSFALGASLQRSASDLALLELDQPIRSDEVSPFATGAAGAEGAQVGVISYAHDRMEVPSMQEVCDVMASGEGVLLLACDVDFGSSGAPVFVLRHGQPTIVSVISAKADYNGQRVALGTSLLGPLEDLRALMAEQRGDGSLRVGVNSGLPSNGSGNADGARFVRAPGGG